MISLVPVFGLALVDSLSVGTLVIPLMLVLNQRKVDARLLTVYFTTVCLCYFAIGAAVFLGLDAVRTRLSDILARDPVYWIQLVIGVSLLAYGVLAPDPGKAAPADIPQPKNLGNAGVLTLAVIAVALEVATMVPYMAAIAILTQWDVASVTRLGVLALYCLVMIVPALLSIGLVALIGEKVWPRIQRFANWAERETKITLLWVAALAGIYLVANAAMNLGWIQ